ncbi:hypothetical protein [Nonomuraea insulae]|uniref:Uncharacterized protein n=1 Tax=Nonomuraea insulae TaxID=1616787 RepID=A0ABW1D4Z6_9ACTN
MRFVGGVLGITFDERRQPAHVIDAEQVKLERPEAKSRTNELDLRRRMSTI